MMKGKKYKIPIVTGLFYVGYLTTAFSSTQIKLLKIEKKWGIEETITRGELWLKRYEQKEYIKAFNFTRKWAIDLYLKDKKDSFPKEVK